MTIDRTDIIKAIEDGLKNNPAVFAFWLEGADSTGRVDAYSDIDVWLDVQDGEEAAVFDAIEKALSGLGNIDFSYQPEQSHPLIKQKELHLEGTPEYLVIDICIQSHSRDYEFVRGIGDDPLVIFNRGGMLFRDADETDFYELFTDRLYHLRHTFTQQFRVLAKVERGDFLEAWSYYSKWTLQPLVELLRIKYAPGKYDHFFKHINRDLPGEVVLKLEELVRIDTIEDIRRGVAKAAEMFEANVEEVERSIVSCNRFQPGKRDGE